MVSLIAGEVYGLNQVKHSSSTEKSAILRLSPVTQAFVDQLARDTGATLVFVCCKCDPRPALDSNALMLFNEECPTHGRSWHRLMAVQPDGSLALALPLHPPAHSSGSDKL